MQLTLVTRAVYNEIVPLHMILYIRRTERLAAEKINPMATAPAAAKKDPADRMGEKAKEKKLQDKDFLRLESNFRPVMSENWLLYSINTDDESIHSLNWKITRGIYYLPRVYYFYRTLFALHLGSV